MARVINKLSARQVATLKTEGMHSDGGGLYLRIADGNRYWVFRYASRITGKDRQLGIGPTHTWDLAQAREKARQYRQMLSDGRDPLDERRAQEASNAVENAKWLMTFDEAAKQYIADHEAAWSNGQHATQWRTSLERFVSPVIGNLPVKAIDRALVVQVLKPHWETTTETMLRVRARIEAVLGWATATGLRDGENPAAWAIMKHLLPDPKKIKRVDHHAALPYAEMGTFMTELRKRDSIGAWGLELAILTATRTNEVLGATWDEFDLNAKIWTIPLERMKARKEHLVPLSSAAIAVIEKAKAIRHEDRVFPIARIDRAIPEAYSSVTVHGFRSTFRDWAGDCTGVERDIVEAALAHAVGNAVEQAYRRSTAIDKRRTLMNMWADYCSGVAVTANNVTPLRKQVPG